MTSDAEKRKQKLLEKNEMNGPIFKIKDDPRVTREGVFLKKYSIDELPRLWSVFIGDMSLVGPSPAGIQEWEKYEEWHKRKLSVTFAMTCLWLRWCRDDYGAI